MELINLMLAMLLIFAIGVLAVFTYLERKEKRRRGGS